MQFSKLAKYFGRIEATSLRNEKTVILAEILKEASVSEVDKLVYLALGGLRPAFDRLEFNLAQKLIVRAIGVSWGEYQKLGDLGELAVKVKQDLRFKIEDLSIEEVYGKLEIIARDFGSGSQERKVRGLAKLIGEMDATSAKYIVRMVAGKLRLGFSDKTVLDALSYLEDGTKKYSEQLDRAYQVRPDVGVLAREVKSWGVDKAVANITIEMGTPIVPALAQRLKTAKEMIEKMGRVYVEPKYDGTRVQIHFSRKDMSQKNKKLEVGREQVGMFEVEEKPKFWVKSFTRNLDESSAMFPELQRIEKQIQAEEIILDCEAVGYDPKTLKLVPFQLTITRKRKHGVEEAESNVPLRFFVFDIMYLDGKSLIHLPLHERRRILSETVKDEGVLEVDKFIETNDSNHLREYHKQQLLAGVEGALVKQMEGQYMPGRTGFNWVKFKEAEDSRAKLSDTIDCVIMGYYLGRGKRNKFGMGAFLIGVAAEDRVVTLAKVGTGITDEVFGQLFERLQKVKSASKNESFKVPKILEPDVWVEPEIVVEVAADEITRSPTHSAGWALRFPRLVKFREDKGVEQITTLREIEEMSRL